MNHKQKNIYVVDTCALIDDPDIFYKLGESRIVISTAVMKELDGLKRNSDPDETRAKAARKVARTLDALGSRQNITSGARTSTGSVVSITGRHVPIADLASNADNRIVGTALRLKDETASGKVMLLSSDINMRNVARSYGIEAAAGHPLFHNSLIARNARPPQKTGVSWNIIVAMAVVILLVLFLCGK